MSEYSEQEIDLRPYIDAVLSNWYWILGLALVVGIVAYIATSALVSPSYEATALVSITEPRQRLQFDPRIVTVEENQPLKAYPEIAVSDELLSILQAESPTAAAYSLQQLRSILKASPGSDPSLLRLSATYVDPETAAEIANDWAELFVTWANRTYGDSSEEQLTFFEESLDTAAVDLQVAEEALVEYQARNLSTIKLNELEALKKTHADLLAKEGEIELLFQDIDSLLALSQNSDSTASDQFTARILKLRAFGGPPSDAEVRVPWQLQVGTEALTADDAADSQEQIVNLRAALEIQAEQTTNAISALEPQILAVQEAWQEATATENLLISNIEVAQDTYTTLARAVDEKRITSQDTNTGVSLASRSAVPTSPTEPPTMRNALGAFLVVLLLAVAALVLLTWWRSDEDSA
jgi:capsular polysaccharide biosynthesis protein